MGYWVPLSLHGRPTWSVNLEECLSTRDSPWCGDSREILLPSIKIGCRCLLSKHCAIIVVIGICPKENKQQTDLFYLLFYSFVCLLVWCIVVPLTYPKVLVKDTGFIILSMLKIYCTCRITMPSSSLMGLSKQCKGQGPYFKGQYYYLDLTQSLI